MKPARQRAGFMPETAFMRGICKPFCIAVPPVFLATLLCGCGTGADAPKTYPVKGKVVFKDGTPMTGGLISFQSVTPSNNSVSGEIQPDGTFALTTRTDKASVSGAPEGQYSVSIMPLLSGDQTQQPDLGPIFVKDHYTVKPDDTNDFTITVARPARR